jgi:RimJ/RimL family protein N-acetyltransferase
VKTGKYEIGWHLDPAVWGMGYATEAAKALIEQARNADVTCLHAVVYADNHKSSAVCERLQMKRVGLTDDWYNESLIEYVLYLN